MKIDDARLWSLRIICWAAQLTRAQFAENSWYLSVALCGLWRASAFGCFRLWGSHRPFALAPVLISLRFSAPVFLMALPAIHSYTVTPSSLTAPAGRGSKQLGSF